MTPPSIDTSTREERLAFIREEWKCISNCESCGHCQILHGLDAEEAFADYIDGKRSYLDISIELRRQEALV